MDIQHAFQQLEPSELNLMKDINSTLVKRKRKA